MSATVKVTLGEVESVYKCTYPLARAIEVILHHSDCAEEIEQEPCDDCISRQAAIDEVRFGQSYITKISPDGTLEHLFDAENKALEEAVERIEQLPPVTSTEKVGQWEWNQYDSNPKIGNFHCSQCHGIGKSYYDYCPYCGTKILASPTGAEGRGKE